MKMSQIKAEIWVQALLRRAQVEGVMGGVLTRGDPDAGAVLLRVARLDGTAELYAPARDLDGNRIWMRPLGNEAVPEADIDAYCRRRQDDDPDLWVVELEDRQGRHFLTEPVE
jgi:hypothetical protein